MTTADNAAEVAGISNDLAAAMAQVRMLYAARIGGVLLVARGDLAAALAALVGERDAALALLRQTRPVRPRRRRRYRMARTSLAKYQPSP